MQQGKGNPRSLFTLLYLSSGNLAFVPSLPRFARCRTKCLFSSPDDYVIDSETLGEYSEKDYECNTKFEWDESEDPNDLDPSMEYFDDVKYNEDGVQTDWDPIFGPSNPIDERTIVTPVESYMVDPSTRDDSMLPSVVNADDPENAFNEEIKQLRKDMKIVDTYIDPWLNMEVPRNVAPWHGYHEELSFPKKDFMNNRFTKPEDKTDFSSMTPFVARETAVSMARSNNNEWLPEGTSLEYKRNETRHFRRLDVLAGSLRKGECDPEVVEKIQPVLKVLGNIVELLSIQETFFRFRYYGQMKNRIGMEAWTKMMISENGVEVTGVRFETGGRKRDAADC